jgi:hypothetical protein
VVYFFYMASKEVALPELAAMLTHVIAHIATKEDIAEVKDDIADIGAAMALISRSPSQGLCADRLRS